jgi:methylenetetrahydrofolate dehydrogenase (NADP+)/methenyltetrahydrofolate cyclohydrolase
MGEIIKGKPVADAISEELIQKVEMLKTKDITPKLAIVRVGADSSDLAYERGALKRCEAIGMLAEVKELPVDISQDDFIAELKKINEDKSVNGILTFRPFPKQLDEKVIKYIIAPEKDVDCFSPVNVAKIMENDATGFAPCTPSAVMEILKYYRVPRSGKKAVVVGRSMVVGKPVSMLLLNENATVTICHSKTEDMPGVCSEADILVVGIGRAKMINSSYVKEGAVVIDVGINVDENGNMCGDVDTEDCLTKATMITPVPAGVGSVTTSILAKQTIKACMQQNNIL